MQPSLSVLFSMFVALFANPAEARDWQMQAEPGQRLAAHAYCAGLRQATCTENTLPKIEVTSPPNGGTISFGNTMQNNVFTRIGEARTEKKCPAMPRHCVEIMHSTITAPTEVA
jgi:hypothetical protein